MVNWTDVFKALANQNRLEIFRFLREEGGNPGVTELAKRFELSASTTSEHLKELRRAGLIKMKKIGSRVTCSVDQEMLRQLGEFFEPGREPQ